MAKLAAVREQCSLPEILVAVDGQPVDDWYAMLEHLGDAAGVADSDTVAAPVHVYAAEGIYDVTLVVANACSADTLTLVAAVQTSALSAAGAPVPARFALIIRAVVSQEGLALRQSGRYAEAVELFSNLHDAYPAFERVPEALFQKAEILDLYLFRHSDALLTYLLLERDYPKAPQVEPARRQVRAAWPRDVRKLL